MLLSSLKRKHWVTWLANANSGARVVGGLSGASARLKDWRCHQRHAATGAIFAGVEAFGAQGVGDERIAIAIAIG